MKTSEGRRMAPRDTVGPAVLEVLQNCNGVRLTVREVAELVGDKGGPRQVARVLNKLVDRGRLDVFEGVGSKGRAARSYRLRPKVGQP